METWYKSLMADPDNKAAAIAAVDQVFSDFLQTGRDPDVIELIRWMFEGYVDHYSTDSEWEILAVEYRFHTPLLTASGRRSGFVLKGGVDLVTRHRITGRIWIWDHKSAANLPKDRDLDFDDQLGLYDWGLKRMGKNIFSCMHSTARTQRNKSKPQELEDRFMRVPSSRTDRELANIEQEALATARSAYSHFNRHERHPDSDTCRWKCEFKEACLAGRKTDDAYERVFLGDIGFRQDYTRH
jgi:hypothetical protein